MTPEALEESIRDLNLGELRRRNQKSGDAANCIDGGPLEALPRPVFRVSGTPAEARLGPDDDPLIRSAELLHPLRLFGSSRDEDVILRSLEAA